MLIVLSACVMRLTGQGTLATMVQIFLAPIVR